MLVAAGVIGIGIDMTFEHDLGGGGHPQRDTERLDNLGSVPTQQSGKLVFRETVGNRGDGAQNGGRVGPQRHGHGIWLARMHRAMILEIERSATVRQPAHDELVAGDHLLAVDAQVLPRLVRSLRDDQTPGHERRHVARPAVLHRQPGQIDIIAFPHHLLARGRVQLFRRHVPQGLEQAAHVHQVLESFGRFGFLQ